MKKIIILLLVLALIFYLSGLDLATLRFFESRRLEPLSSLALALAFLGSKSFLIPFNLLFFYFYRKLSLGLFLPLATLASWTINHLIKEVIRRPRPPITSLAFEGSFSFPSGHAMVTASFIFLLAYFIKTHYKKDIYSYAYFYLGLMMLSRVYIGVHYPSDVLVGAALGLLFAKILINYKGEKDAGKD